MSELGQQPGQEAVVVERRGRARDLFLDVILEPEHRALLGTAAYRGRLLLPDDARAGAPRAVVVSHEFWQTRLGGDSAAVGQTVSINGEPATVVGVAAPAFRVPHGSSVLQADLYAALPLDGAVLTVRRSNFLWMFGRLRPEATIETAHAEMQMLFGNLVRQFPELNGEGLRVAPLHAENVGPVRTALLLLFGAVTLVLLIAVTNVAAHLLARGVQRRREMAVRVALSATGAR